MWSSWLAGDDSLPLPDVWGEGNGGQHSMSNPFKHTKAYTCSACGYCYCNHRQMVIDDRVHWLCPDRPERPADAKRLRLATPDPTGELVPRIGYCKQLRTVFA
jgi:hypothetical protein